MNLVICTSRPLIDSSITVTGDSFSQTTKVPGTKSRVLVEIPDSGNVQLTITSSSLQNILDPVTVETFIFDNFYCCKLITLKGKITVYDETYKHLHIPKVTDVYNHGVIWFLGELEYTFSLPIYTHLLK